MARFEVSAPDALMVQLQKAGKTDTTISAMLDAAAKPLHKSIRRRAKLHDRSVPSQHMSDAIKIGKAKKNKYGDWVIKVQFAGHDKTRKPTSRYPKGVPQAIKAAGIEYGNAHEAARPFLDAAAKDAEPEILDALQNEYNKGISQ